MLNPYEQDVATIEYIGAMNIQYTLHGQPHSIDPERLEKLMGTEHFSRLEEGDKVLFVYDEAGNLEKIGSL